MSELAMQVQKQILPLTKTEAFFSLMFGEKMKPVPKRYGSPASATKRFDTDRQWIFLGGKYQMKSVATLATLFAVLSDPKVGTTYYTPNGYYRRDQRLTEALRWLNAYVFDIDEPGISVQDVLDRTDQAGLPRPTAIIRTPSGGVHVTYIFTAPVRATQKAIRLYTVIMSHMADDLGADKAAVGANRIFRTPTDQTLIYFDPEQRYNFDVFKDWRDVNHPYDMASQAFINVHTGDLMSHPALMHLLSAPCEVGKRDLVAFNLALAMKASGWTQAEAETALKDWYHLCCEKSGKNPFTERDAIYKAKYVYRSSKLHAPKASVIRELTGMDFYYQNRSQWAQAKERSERIRSHLYEWEADLLALLVKEKELTGTQQELADMLQADGHTCPLTSFRAVLRKLKDEGRIIVESRRGRGGKTTIRLVDSVESATDNIAKENITVHSGRDQVATTITIYVDFVAKKIEKTVCRLPANVKVPDQPPEPPD